MCWQKPDVSGFFLQPAAAACWWPGAVCRMAARESLQPENAKSARNHPQQGRGAGKHNIGHHGKQLWRWMAGGGGGGGAGVGGGDLEVGSASARIALGCLAPHHLLLLLYTAPPVAHLSLGHPSSPESTCPAPNICHSCTNICLPTTRHICFHHIFVFLIYLSRPNTCHSPMFLSIRYLFLRAGSFPCFVSRSPVALLVYFVGFHFCEIVEPPHCHRSFTTAS